MSTIIRTGFLNIYKEAGFTSHDVVAKLRGMLHTKKIGHTGTLDPAATGVLPVAVGRATKAIDLLPDHSKAYTAELLLGTKTDTYDTTGVVLEKKEVHATEEQIAEAMRSFVGRIAQMPPMYSAKRVNGKRLYELARTGVEVEREPAAVQIDSIEIVEIRIPYVRFHVECSKGTYIRSLCYDIGEKLGCGGCMGELLRTRAGSFRLENALHLDEVQRAVDENRIDSIFLPIDMAFENFPKGIVSKNLTNAAVNGALIPSKSVNLTEKADNTLNAASSGTAAKENDELSLSDAPMVRLYLFDGRFLGLYSYDGRVYRIKKMFLE